MERVRHPDMKLAGRGYLAPSGQMCFLTTILSLLPNSLFSPTLLLPNSPSLRLPSPVTPSSLSPRLITHSPCGGRCAGHAAAGTNFDAMGNVRLVNRLARCRLGSRSRIPVLVENAAVRCSTVVNDLSVDFVKAFIAARVASRAAAQIAAQPREDATTAAVIGAVAFAVEEASNASQATRFAASAATAGEAAAAVARIAAIGRIAHPLAPIDIAATLAAGGLTMKPALDAAVTTADRLAAGAAFRVVALGHPLFIRPAKQRAPPAAARSAPTTAHILAAAATSQKRGSTNPNRPPGNHREVL